MANRFVAVDVETANADLSTICQIGLVLFDDGELKWTWESLVDPEDFFDGWNVSIHGITDRDIEGKPTFADIYAGLQKSLTNQVVVCHTPFDRVAITRAIEKYELSALHCVWLDSARVVRRAWPEQFAQSGYGLANCTAELGIEFRHHDAAEDARAAGELMNLAIEHTDKALDEWLVRVTEPIWGAYASYPSQNVAREGNPDGPLAGESVVFTGALSISRVDAADLAARAGCNVSKGVTKKTTLLVVGDQDIRRLAGHTKSSKHRKAEDLIQKGQLIRIVAETDFLRIVDVDQH
jgi:DNA polymerase-3 subunit epsilon